MRVLYGTHNAAKLEYMRRALEGLPVEILSPAVLGLRLSVDENGRDPLENARLKAWAYHRASGLPALGCDSGLYIAGLPAAEQPGVHVRRVGGQELDDEGFIRHYAQLARRLGGRAEARFVNGVCLVLGGSEVYEVFDDSVATGSFTMTAEPSPLRTPGFPMHSVALYPGTDRYWVQDDDAGGRGADIGADIGAAPGLRAFFARVLAAQG